MKKKNIFKILTVVISSIVILGCFAACDKNPEVPDEPTTNISAETPDATDPTDEVTTDEGTSEEEEPTVELPTEDNTTEEDATKEDETTTKKDEDKITEEDDTTTEVITSKPVETTKKEETTTKKPVETTTKKPVETTTKKQDTAKYTTVNQTVYATENVNIRKEASTSAAKVGGLKKGQSIKRIAIGDNGWSKVELNGITAYVASNYLTTTKPTTTTQKPVTTTKKPVETTTQKSEETTTKKPTGSATQTSGGIALKPVTSSTAKTIANNWSTCSVDPHYEGKSADGKTIVVYAKTPAGWTGRDASGARYNAAGEKKICEYCKKISGTGNNMCRGNCAVTFN